MLYFEEQYIHINLDQKKKRPLTNNKYTIYFQESDNSEIYSIFIMAISKI